VQRLIGARTGLGSHSTVGVELAPDQFDRRGDTALYQAEFMPRSSRRVGDRDLLPSLLNRAHRVGGLDIGEFPRRDNPGNGCFGETISAACCTFRHDTSSIPRLDLNQRRRHEKGAFIGAALGVYGTEKSQHPYLGSEGNEFPTSLAECRTWRGEDPQDRQS
jgi:hypothetical protein